MINCTRRTLEIACVVKRTNIATVLGNAECEFILPAYTRFATFVFCLLI